MYSVGRVAHRRGNKVSINLLLFQCVTTPCACVTDMRPDFRMMADDRWIAGQKFCGLNTHLRLRGVIAEKKMDTRSHRCHYSTLHSNFDSVLFVCLSFWRLLVLVNIDRDRFYGEESSYRNWPPLWVRYAFLKKGLQGELNLCNVVNAKILDCWKKIAEAQRISCIFVISVFTGIQRFKTLG